MTKVNQVAKHHLNSKENFLISLSSYSYISENYQISHLLKYNKKYYYQLAALRKIY